MKKSTVSRFLALALSAVAVLSLAACGSKKEEVSNTVGKVTITMDEAKVNNEGTTIVGLGSERIEHNTYKKLLPGGTYSKDTTIHVGSKSNDCWLFIQMNNGFASVESTAAGAVSVAAQMEANGWTLLEGTSDIYAYNTIAKGGDHVRIMENFTLSADTTEDAIAALELADIVVTPYAVEAEGHDSAAAAWTASGFGA